MSTQASPPKQPNPPVEKQSKPSPEVQPRKTEDKDFEREGQWAGRNNDGTTSPAKK